MATFFISTAQSAAALEAADVMGVVALGLRAPPAARTPHRTVTLRDLKADQDPALWRSILINKGLGEEPAGPSSDTFGSGHRRPTPAIFGALSDHTGTNGHRRAITAGLSSLSDQGANNGHRGSITAGFDATGAYGRRRTSTAAPGSPSIHHDAPASPSTLESDAIAESEEAQYLADPEPPDAASMIGPSGRRRLSSVSSFNTSSRPLEDVLEGASGIIGYACHGLPPTPMLGLYYLKKINTAPHTWLFDFKGGCDTTESTIVNGQRVPKSE